MQEVARIRQALSASSLAVGVPVCASQKILELPARNRLARERSHKRDRFLR